MIQPVEAIGRLARPDDCLLFADAAQAIGHLPLTLPAIGCDVLTAPARKWLRGPRGQAVMALSERALRVLGQPVMIDQIATEWQAAWQYSVRDDAQRFETFDYSVGGRLGLGVAIDNALGLGLQRIRETVARKVLWLRAALSDLAGVAVLEADGADAAFLTLAAADIDPAALCRALRKSGVVVSAVDTNLARRELEARGLTAALRVSPHIYTSADDLQTFIDRLAEALRHLRR